MPSMIHKYGCGHESAEHICPFCAREKIRDLREGLEKCKELANDAIEMGEFDTATEAHLDSIRNGCASVLAKTI